jgi:hypothetical protein
VKAEVAYGSGNRANKTVTLYVNGEKAATKETGDITNAGGNRSS